MSLQDPIADMLTRIRNAQMVCLPTVAMPASKLKTAIAKVLQEEGYILGFREDGDGAGKVLHISLKYHNGKAVIDNIRRISKPSLRIYKGKGDIPKVMNGLGVAIMSTPNGVMTGKHARALGVGGEILCYVS